MRKWVAVFNWKNFRAFHGRFPNSESLSVAHLTWQRKEDTLPGLPEYCKGEATATWSDGRPHRRVQSWFRTIPCKYMQILQHSTWKSWTLLLQLWTITSVCICPNSKLYGSPFFEPLEHELSQLQSQLKSSTVNLYPCYRHSKFKCDRFLRSVSAQSLLLRWPSFLNLSKLGRSRSKSMRRLLSSEASCCLSGLSGVTMGSKL